MKGFLTIIVVFLPVVTIIVYLIYTTIMKIKNQVKFVIDWDIFSIIQQGDILLEHNISNISRFHILEYIGGNIPLIGWTKTTKYNLEIYNTKNTLILKLGSDDFSVSKFKKIVRELRKINPDIVLLKWNFTKDSSWNIFVYGTLMNTKIQKAITGKKFKMKDAILPWYKRYWIIRWNKKLAYPAISISGEDKVKGKLLTRVSIKNQDLLDLYEWYEYIPKTVQVIYKDKIILAKAYIWIQNINDLQWNWSLEEFERKYLDKYINEKIPKIMNQFR